MLIGEVFGSTGTKSFNFRAYKEVRKFDFIAVEGEGKWILAQVENLESHPDGKSTASAKVIGYREDGALKSPKVPIKPNALVYSADGSLIQEVLKFEKSGIYLGRLEANSGVPVYIDPKDLISKHLAVLAATGSGKSYTVGIILEELLEKNIPVVILDPHGEYTSLKFANDSPEELSRAEKFDIIPRAYPVMEYSPDTKVNSEARQISFSDKNLEPSEIIHILPTKPTSSQLGVLYGAIKELKEEERNYGLNDIIKALESSNSAAKWAVINMLEIVKGTGLFSSKPTDITDIVKPGTASVINLRGVSQEIQGLVVYKIVETLFEKRKVGKIPPMFLIVEEAHNFCPEREVRTSSKIIRSVAFEGRKFGMGLCIISQRPAHVDKNVLSQCNTQIILRMTNPNDLKAVSYAEGLTSGLEKEIKAINPGTALILGREIPIFVSMRIRRTRHGGVTVNIEQPKPQEDIFAFRTMKKSEAEEKFGKVNTIYYPCWRVMTERQNLIEAVRGKVIFSEGGATKECDIELGEEQLKILGEMRHDRTLDELKKRTKLDEETLIAALRELVEKKYVSETEKNGNVVYEKTLKSAFRGFEGDPNYIKKDEGAEVLDFAITKEEALRRGRILFGEVTDVQKAYYTYYLDVDKKFMVDGFTGVMRMMVAGG